MNRNLLYLIIGVLAVTTAGLGYQSYKASQEPSGVNINVGDKGLSITTK
jgi:hypothetical protein